MPSLLDMKSAETEGAHAFAEGHPLSANPYHEWESSLRRKWEYGWTREAEKHALDAAGQRSAA